VTQAHGVPKEVQKSYPLREVDVHPETGEALMLLHLSLETDVVSVVVGPPSYPDKYIFVGMGGVSTAEVRDDSSGA
jgi:hypothetical protein